MGKISVDKLQGSRQRDNSVNGTSSSADSTAANPGNTQSGTESGNISGHHIIDKIGQQEAENELPQGQTKSPNEIIEAGDPVNMATGEYIYEDKDFILPDMEGEYSLTRSEVV